jgi:hypothetical protein
MEKKHCHFEYRKLYLAWGIGINNAKGLKGTETRKMTAAGPHFCHAPAEVRISIQSLDNPR